MKIDIALQPIVLPMSGRVASYEVLARGVDPYTGKVTLPVDLVRGADNFGWDDIDLAVLTRLRASLDQIPAQAGLNVNIAPETIVSREYWDQYCSLLEDLVRVHTAPLVVELSERIDIEESDLADVIGPLRELGAQIALDDLGAEWASRSRLAFHSWDICKIDFRPQARAHVAHWVGDVIAMCRRDNVLTVLEGVESAQDVLMARGMNVDRCQGFAHGRPFILNEGESHSSHACIQGRRLC